FQDHLELAPRELPARLLPVELAAAVHVLAGLGDGPRHRRDESDADRPLGRGLLRRAEERHEGERDGRDQDARVLSSGPRHAGSPKSEVILVDPSMAVMSASGVGRSKWLAASRIFGSSVRSPAVLTKMSGRPRIQWIGRSM